MSALLMSQLITPDELIHALGKIERNTQVNALADVIPAVLSPASASARPAILTEALVQHAQAQADPRAHLQALAATLEAAAEAIPPAPRND